MIGMQIYTIQRIIKIEFYEIAETNNKMFITFAQNLDYARDTRCNKFY